ncbi:Y-family DNA polymerase [Furfurilactobacillus cerevisiae]|uniref:Y-family DNA polymerase n=1 Tax=Furfurilactobacillus rossiae TaxID=231049 RepID=UPI003B97E2D6
MDYDYDVEPHGVYFLVDNKSFYCSVEASLRGYNPLTVNMVVMSEQENTNGGLILATSPEAKKRYGLKANVSRQRDLPQDEALIVVPPRMNLYIKRNLQINDIFRRFVADEDLWPYSIDESILDMTHSWRLFGKTPLDVAKKIQRTVHEELGLYVTVGIGENPVQAKIALDVYAKHQPSLIGIINYQNVPDKIWTIQKLTDVWSIADRTAKHLNRLGIHNMYELAHYSPYKLKAELGVIGSQLFALSWGVDRTQVSKRVPVKSSSIGNSQVLPRDYSKQYEIETVIKEIGEQVAARLRSHHKTTASLSLGIGFSYAASEATGRGGFHQQLRIDPTNDNKPIVASLISMFREQWQGEIIRNVSVYTARFAPSNVQQLDLFKQPEDQVRNADFERVVDKVRQKFGFTSLVFARSAIKGGTAINRASLVGGHNGGNAYE